MLTDNYIHVVIIIQVCGTQAHRANNFRNEMFLHLGYYVTESSGHNSEYNWWFRKRADLIKKYCGKHKGANWNPGEYAFILKHYQKQGKTWRNDIRKWLAHPEKIDLTSRKLRGIGLISIKQWITAMEGTMSIESQPGKGARVTIDIPLTDPEKT